MADREGRLEDRPKQIKIEVLPADDCDIESFLNMLQSKGFIFRYDRNGLKYIVVRNFKKHQNPHKKEPESQIPGPVREFPGPDREIPGLVSEIPAQAGLIPDSSFPTPDPNITALLTDVNQSVPTSLVNGNDKDASKEEREPSPEMLVDLWNRLAHPNFPRVKIMTETRRRHIRARLAAHPDKQFWIDTFNQINSSRFLRGEGPSRGVGGPWRADFDWIMNPSNLVKVLEGVYNGR